MGCGSSTAAPANDTAATPPEAAGGNVVDMDPKYKMYTKQFTKGKALQPKPNLTPFQLDHRRDATNELFDMLDVSKNGVITASEFALWVHPYKHMSEQQEKELRDKNAFLLFNINKRCNAEINRQELHEYCEYFTPAEVDFMVEDMKIKQKTEHYRRASSSISLLNLQEPDEVVAVTLSRTHTTGQEGAEAAQKTVVAAAQSATDATSSELPPTETFLKRHLSTQAEEDPATAGLDDATAAAIAAARAAQAQAQKARENMTEEELVAAAQQSRRLRGSMQMGGAGLDQHADEEALMSDSEREALLKLEALPSSAVAASS